MSIIIWTVYITTVQFECERHENCSFIFKKNINDFRKNNNKWDFNSIMKKDNPILKLAHTKFAIYNKTNNTNFVLLLLDTWQ